MAHGWDAHDAAFQRTALEPGVFVLVSVDPLATLAPLNDPHASQQAHDMSPAMKKYLAFVRSVDHPSPSTKRVASPPSSAFPNAAPPPVAASPKPKLHINLLHTAPPRPSAGVDESMCVPVWPTHAGSSSSSSNNSGRPPLRPTNYLGWREVYVHTVMDAHVRVSHCNERGFRPAVAPLLPPREMLRFDRYQAEDHAREADRYRHMENPAAALAALDKDKDLPGPPRESLDLDVDEEPDLDDADLHSEDYRLSTLMSGITFDARSSSSSSSSCESLDVLQQRHPTAPRTPHPLQTQMPGASRQRPISVVSTDSTFSFRSVATLSSQASDSPYIPTFRQPSDTESDESRQQRQEQRRRGQRLELDPPSPTVATDLSGSTRVASYANLNAKAKLSPPPLPLPHKPSHADSMRPSTNWAHPSYNDEEDEDEEQTPSKSRQCHPHIRVWFDLSLVDEPADPREFFEELKALRSVERASDLRYLEELRRANAERVAAWNQLTIPLPASIPMCPIPLRRRAPQQKSLPPTPTAATFCVPPTPTTPAFEAGSVCTPSSVWSLVNGVDIGVTPAQSAQGTVKAERRKSAVPLKPLKTFWRKMKSHSNLKAA